MTIFSYNSTGFSEERVRFMKDLFENCNAHIFSLQEVMILRENYYKLENAFPQYSSYYIPAKKANNNIYSGRPSGGLAIFWKNDIAFKKNPTKVTSLQSDRVQGIVFHMEENTNLLIINAYFPVDKEDFDEYELLKEHSYYRRNGNCI